MGVMSRGLAVDVSMSGIRGERVMLETVDTGRFMSLGVCNRNISSQNLRGDIAEVVIYRRKLSDVEWVDVERHLMYKFNLQ